MWNIAYSCQFHFVHSTTRSHTLNDNAIPSTVSTVRQLRSIRNLLLFCFRTGWEGRVGHCGREARVQSVINGYLDTGINSLMVGMKFMAIVVVVRECWRWSFISSSDVTMRSNIFVVPSRHYQFWLASRLSSVVSCRLITEFHIFFLFCPLIFMCCFNCHNQL